MNNYQILCDNLKQLKLTQMAINLPKYLDAINEDKISVVE